MSPNREDGGIRIHKSFDGKHFSRLPIGPLFCFLRKCPKAQSLQRLSRGEGVMKASRYCPPVMKQLTDQQVRYAPRDVRLTQIRRAERLVRELDPGRSYPYHEICERVTTFRPEMYPDLVIQGGDAVHDLRCFVEDLS